MKTRHLFLVVIALAASLIISASFQSTTLSYNVVGTGVTICYNNTIQITCPTITTEPFYGQNQGINPSYQNNGNGTTTDLNTGLTWVKDRGTKICWDSAFITAAQCNVGGYTDWRVPTIKELYSLINFNGKSGINSSSCVPYIDTNYFGWKTGDTLIGERVIDGQDWSATKYKALTMISDSTIFGVNFIDGRIKGYPQYKPGTGNTIRQTMYIRFVRGNTGYGVNNFVDNADSTITDNATGLMWTKNDSRAGMNWQSALAWAQSKNTANYLGYNDWRLPTIKELQSIVDYTRCKDYTNSAAINPVFNISSISDESGSTNWPCFWSNTTHKDNMGGAYIAFGEALGWIKSPPTAAYYTLFDVHGAGAQRSDPKSGSYTTYYLGVDINGQPVYGLGPQGDVIRINNYVRLVRTAFTTGVINQGSETPSAFKLYQNYPNPFNPATSIKFALPKQGLVTLKIYDMLGKEVITLVNEIKSAGNFTVDFNASELSSGIYFYKLVANDFSDVKKMILIK